MLIFGRRCSTPLRVEKWENYWVYWSYRRGWKRVLQSCTYLWTQTSEIVNVHEKTKFTLIISTKLTRMVYWYCYIYALQNLTSCPCLCIKIHTMHAAYHTQNARTPQVSYWSTSGDTFKSDNLRPSCSWLV